MSSYNRDGYLDLAITQSMSAEVSVMLGKGDGSFPSHVEYATGSSPLALQSINIVGTDSFRLLIHNFLPPNTPGRQELHNQCDV